MNGMDEKLGRQKAYDKTVIDLLRSLAETEHLTTAMIAEIIAIPRNSIPALCKRNKIVLSGESVKPGPLATIRLARRLGLIRQKYAKEIHAAVDTIDKVKKKK